MASGRPRQPNDPSIMASVEAALSTVPRPNLVVRLWHWRYELGLIAEGLLGAITIGFTLGLDWLIAVAPPRSAVRGPGPTGAVPGSGTPVCRAGTGRARCRAYRPG